MRSSLRQKGMLLNLKTFFEIAYELLQALDASIKQGGCGEWNNLAYNRQT